VLGEIVLETRRDLGLSQRALAVRAGMTQASVSRIERGLETPSLVRFEQLMLAMGRRAAVSATPLEHGLDTAELEAGRRLSHGERLREAASWNLVAMQLELAGAAARGASHAATRRRG